MKHRHELKLFPFGIHRVSTDCMVNLHARDDGEAVWYCINCDFKSCMNCFEIISSNYQIISRIPDADGRGIIPQLNKYSGPLSGYYVALLILSKRTTSPLVYKIEEDKLIKDLGPFEFVGIPTGYHLRGNDTCLKEQLKIWGAPEIAIRNVDHKCIEIDEEDTLWVYYRQSLKNS